MYIILSIIFQANHIMSRIVGKGASSSGACKMPFHRAELRPYIASPGN